MLHGINRALPSLGLAALAMLAGCGSTPPAAPASLWVPSARAQFVTLGRSTSYALVHEAGQDLLIVEDPVLSGDGRSMTGRLTWIVPVPETAPFDTPIEFSSSDRRAWLVEQVEGSSTHAVPVSGRVVVHHRDAERLSASLNLRALGETPAAGQPQRASVDLDRRLEFDRREAPPPQHREMGRRAGVRVKRAPKPE